MKGRSARAQHIFPTTFRREAVAAARSVASVDGAISGAQPGHLALPRGAKGARPLANGSLR